MLDDATVLKLLLAGKSQADAQRALGVCVRTVRDRCAKTRQTLKVLRSSRKRIDKRAKMADGDKMHRMITLTTEQIAAAQNMRDHGVPWRELAANMLLRFGVKASHQFWWNNVPRGPADKRKRRAKA